MIVRNAKLMDIEGCVAISHIPEFSYLHKASDADSKKYLMEFYKKGIILIAEDKNKIVGFIIGEFMLGNFIWIDGLTVRMDYRGKGIGKKLFNKFRDVLKAKGIEHIYLMAPKFNKNTIKFYKSIGLKEGKEFIEFSKDI